MRLLARLALGTTIAATACLAYACSGGETTPAKPDAAEPDTGAPVEASVDAGQPDTSPPTCGSIPTATTKVNSPFAAWADKGPCTDQGCEEGSRVYEVFAKTETPLAPHRMDQCRLLSAIPIQGGYIDRWCCKQGCFATETCGKFDIDSGTPNAFLLYQCDALPDGGHPAPGLSGGDCAPKSNLGNSKRYCCGDFQQ